MKGLKVAILGSGGHIAKSLITHFIESETIKLTLYSTSKEKVQFFLNQIKPKGSTQVFNTDTFPNDNYDVVINCIGIGDPNKLIDIKEKIFELTEKYDELIIRFLKSNPNSLYINLSSGAVYGTSFDKAIQNDSKAEIDVNHISNQDYYRIAKLNSEAKHRSLRDFNIVDLRVFSFFSEFISLESKYLITEIINCILNKKIFFTSQDDIIRDYVHSLDLFCLIQKCIEKRKLNEVYDLYSKSPVSKFEILNYFSKKYLLKYEFNDLISRLSPTGLKLTYYSEYHKAMTIGYSPTYSSLETVIDASHKILKNKIVNNFEENTCL